MEEIRMKWSVAIFSSRESFEILSKSIEAALAASRGETVVDVVINGSRGLADQAGKFVETLQTRRVTARVRVWYVSVADKSHAWNQYLYDIWPGADIAFFVDGYVQVMKDAFAQISDGLAGASNALAGSGVPTMGRSARRLQTKPGIHGNLYAIKGDVLRKVRKNGFRLPLGLYRTDSLVGAIICFGLDPTKNQWDSNRLLIQPRATWRFDPLRWWSITDLRSHWKRVVRQAQGTLENSAVRQHLEVWRKAPEHLPRTATELVFDWMTTSPRAAIRILGGRPFCLLAALRLRSARRDWSQTTIPPLIIADRNG
jgi:hypothetical protein